MKTDDKYAFQFKHVGDGTTRTFRAKQNPLTQDWLYSWNDWGSAFVTTLGVVKSLVSNIRKKAQDVVDLNKE